MHSLRLVVPFVVVLGLTGCGSGEDTVMPEVMGLKLDVALSDIERAGFEGDDVEVLGGGTFGILDKSNWQVCDQSPAAGQAVTAAPRLTVDRSCADATAAPEASETEPVPAEETSESEPAPTESAKVETLTIENNADLAALLAASDYYDKAEEFASQYEGQLIEFDANIALMAPHEDSKTRNDMLIYVGDYSETDQIGPSFKYDDVNVALDLGLTGSNIPDSIGTGDNIRVVARVEDFNSDTGLFFLEPVATEMR